MNFYQKITGLISLVAIISTLAVLRVCFTAPFHTIILTQFSAIVFAEIVLGCTGIFLYGKEEKNLPYSLSVWLPGIIYLVFVLFMIYPAGEKISAGKFILFHGLGAAVLAVWYLIFLLGRRSIEDTGSTGDIGMQNKETMVQLMREVQIIFAGRHPSEKEILKMGDRLIDSFRSASVSVCGSSRYDDQIIADLDELLVLASDCPVNEYRQRLVKIDHFFQLRERM